MHSVMTRSRRSLRCGIPSSECLESANHTFPHISGIYDERRSFPPSTSGARPTCACLSMVQSIPVLPRCGAYHSTTVTILADGV
ncbi:hypothetical protein LENED_012173 [Lentinula edodes]|uniref:Uncharacterized protein n=1 Tax=Lentinula edodes TaxID=5353 RepID=A0A1Q3ES57_LENED|nr:hypothetical protein LENED_012173 [Lentinula edodes]